MRNQRRVPDDNESRLKPTTAFRRERLTDVEGDGGAAEVITIRASRNS